MKLKLSITKILEYLIYLFIFLLPWSTRYLYLEQYLRGEYWEYGSFSLFALDILIALIILVFLILQIKKKNKVSITPLLLITGVFWIICFFNFYWTQDKALSFYYLLRLTEALAIAYIILSAKLDFKKIALAFVSAGLIQSILGIIQFVMQKTWACKWLGMAEHLPEIIGTQVVAGGFGRVLREYGAFPHPNIMGMFLVIAIILAIYLTLSNMKVRRRRLAFMCSIIILQVGLMMTFSRQAWLALCVGLFILLILYRPRKTVVKLIALVALVSIVFILIYSPLVLNRFNFDQALESYSLEQRALHQQDAFTVIQKHWPTGVGLGNYTKIVKTEPVHNIYLLILAELGFLGLICFFLLIGLFFYALIENRQRTLERRISGVIVIVLLLLGCFDHYLWTLFPFSLIFWLWLAFFSVEKT